MKGEHNMQKYMGKILNVKIGYGGYQDAMIGVAFILEGEDFCSGDFFGTWSGERHSSSKWTEEDRLKTLGQAMMKLNELLRDAKCKEAYELIGKPIEVTYVNQRLSYWRILTEVL